MLKIKFIKLPITQKIKFYKDFSLSLPTLTTKKRGFPFRKPLLHFFALNEQLYLFYSLSKSLRFEAYRVKNKAAEILMCEFSPS